MAPHSYNYIEYTASYKYIHWCFFDWLQLDYTDYYRLPLLTKTLLVLSLVHNTCNVPLCGGATHVIYVQVDLSSITRGTLWHAASATYVYCEPGFSNSQLHVQ